MTSWAVSELAGAAAAICAAAETGLLAAILDGAASPARHAARLGLDERAAGAVLEVLVAFGIAERDAGCYRASDALAEVDIAHPIGVVGLATLWSHTARFLRTGEPVARMDGSASERAAAYRDAVPGLPTLLD